MPRIFKFLVCFLFVINISTFAPTSHAYEKEINSVSAEMAEKIAGSGKKTIAVVDFTDLQGNVTELGRFLAEEFSVSLADAGKGFEVVDRTHLRSIVQEHKLSETGMIDSSAARELGKVAGVGALITGTITPFGDSIRIAIKILDTETAKMIGASRANLAKTGALEDLILTGINRDISPKVSPQSTSRKAKNSSENFEGFQEGQVWEGYYVCSQGATDLKLVIQSVNRVSESRFINLSGVFDFNFSNGRATGKFEIYGQYNIDTRELVFKAGKWIKNPNGYRTVGMKGIVGEDRNKYEGRITGASGCGEFSVSL